MRTLLVMRHAKSDWGQAAQSDRDRALNKRGMRDAPRMGRWLRDQSCSLDLLATSTALRAQTTAALVAEANGFDGSPLAVPEFYLAPPRAYLDWLLSIDEGADCVMVVGHNPGVEELIEGITGEVISMPTAAIGVMRIQAKSWEDFAVNPKAELEAIWTPKGIPADFD